MTQESELDHLVLRIWAKALGVSSLSLDDDFFDLGGDSAVALEVVSRIGAELGLTLSVRTLYKAPTPRRLTLALAAPVEPELSPAITRAPRSGQYPASIIQEQSLRRNVLFTQAGLTPPAHNAVCVHRIRGHLDPGALEAAFDHVLAAQEVLRVQFKTGSHASMQVVAKHVGFGLSRGDLGAEGGLRALVTAEWGRRFPAQGPRVRAALYAEDDGWILVTVLDHDVCDGLSLRLFMHSLESTYSETVRGTSVTAPVRRLDYLDWSVAQRRWSTRAGLASVITRWCSAREIVMPPADLIDLAAMHPAHLRLPALEPSYETSIKLPLPMCDRIRAVAAGHHVAIYSFFVAAIFGWLARWTGRDRFIIFSVMHNRNAPESRDMIGWFTNKVPLVGRVTDEEPFAGLMRRAHDETIEAHRLQAIPFVTWVDELHLDLQATFLRPAFIMLNYFEGHVANADELRLAGADVNVVRLAVPLVRTAGLVFTVSVTDHAITVGISTPPGARGTGGVDALLSMFVRLIEGWLAEPDGQVC